MREYRGNEFPPTEDQDAVYVVEEDIDMKTEYGYDRVLRTTHNGLDGWLVETSAPTRLTGGFVVLKIPTKPEPTERLLTRQDAYDLIDLLNRAMAVEEERSWAESGNPDA